MSKCGLAILEDDLKQTKHLGLNRSTCTLNTNNHYKF